MCPQRHGHLGVPLCFLPLHVTFWTGSSWSITMPTPAPPAQPKIQSFTGSWQRAHTSQGCSPALPTKPLWCLSSTSTRLVDNQEWSLNSERATSDMTYSPAWDHARAPKTLFLDSVSLLQMPDSPRPISLSPYQLRSRPCHQYNMDTSNPP